MTSKRYIPQVGDVFEWRSGLDFNKEWTQRTVREIDSTGCVWTTEGTWLLMSEFKDGGRYGFEARLVSRPSADPRPAWDAERVRRCMEVMNNMRQKEEPHLSDKPVLNTVYDGWNRSQVPLTVSVNVGAFEADWADEAPWEVDLFVLSALTAATQTARPNVPAPVCPACGEIADVSWKFDVAEGVASAFWVCKGEKK